MKNLLKLLDLSTEEITGILDLADQLKYERKHNIPHELLKGQTLGMIFQKSSDRPWRAGSGYCPRVVKIP